MTVQNGISAECRNHRVLQLHAGAEVPFLAWADTTKACGAVGLSSD